MYLQPGHEELLELLVYKEGSSTVHSTEVNVFQEEDSADDLRSSRNSSPATEGFSNRGINFKDAYRRVYRLYDNIILSVETKRSTKACC